MIFFIDLSGTVKYPNKAYTIQTCMFSPVLREYKSIRDTYSSRRDVFDKNQHGLVALLISVEQVDVASEDRCNVFYSCYTVESSSTKCVRIQLDVSR